MNFITSKPLWINVLFAVVLCLLLLFLFLVSLGVLTKHGEVLKIPKVTEMSVDEAISRLENAGFEVEIQDSVYKEDLPPRHVIKQFPEPEATVKVNRTVYITVTRTVAPLIEMPNLVGPSFKNAEIVLKQLGLKLGDTTSKPDFAKNSVLNQLYDGKDIAPGTRLPMGSQIDLVLGSGLADVDMAVPDLYGKTYAEARVWLDSFGISVVPIADPDVNDVEEAFIYRQNPGRYNLDKRVNRIRPGQMVDVWLSVLPKPRPDTLNAATPPPAGEAPATSPSNNY